MRRQFGLNNLLWTERGRCTSEKAFRAQHPFSDSGPVKWLIFVLLGSRLRHKGFLNFCFVLLPKSVLLGAANGSKQKSCYCWLPIAPSSTARQLRCLFSCRLLSWGLSERIRIIKHEAGPQYGSFKVRFPDGRSERKAQSGNAGP
jgi:hypothetical protein